MPKGIGQACMAALLLMAVLSGCGGSGSTTSVVPSPNVAPAADTAVPAAAEEHAVSAAFRTRVQAALAELQRLPCPAGVERALWAKLKARLGEQLRARLAGRTASAAVEQQTYGYARYFRVQAARYPASEINWIFRLPGDYDLNTEVNISDITPIGAFFNMTSNDPNWDNGQRADGNEDGVVDIADLDVVGQYFSERLSGFQFERSDKSSASFSWSKDSSAAVTSYGPYELQSADGQIWPTEIAGGGYVVYHCSLAPSLKYSWYRVVPLLYDGQHGELPSTPYQLVYGPGEWSTFGRDNLHTQRSTFSGPANPGRPWSVALGEPVAAAASIGVDGTAYIGTLSGGVYAVDRQRMRLWRFDTGAPVRTSPCIGPDGSVYVAADRMLYQLAQCGTELSRTPLGGAVLSSPALADGFVYVGCLDGKLYRVSADGSQASALLLGGAVSSSPAVSQSGRIYVGCDNGQLYCFGSAGDELWRCKLGAPSGTASPVIGPTGAIFIGSRAGKLFGVSSSGILSWTFDCGDSRAELTSPAVRPDGKLVTAGTNGRLYMLSNRGALLWTYDARQPLHSAPAIDADGMIYFGGGDYTAASSVVYCLYPDSTVKMRASVPSAVYGAAVLYSYGRLMYVGYDGTVQLLGLGPDQPLS